MSLARIRQLSAHEIGHTLGFAHNFAASSYGRASVMDYPAPSVEIKDGKLDLSNAYGRRSATYDKFAVTYAYTPFRRAPTKRRSSPRLSARASPTACSSSPMPTPGPRRGAPAGQPLGQRRRSGGHAHARDGGPPDRSRTVRPRQASDRHAALGARGEAAAALSAPPLPARGGGQVGRRRLLHVRGEGRAKASPEPVAEIVPADRQREALAAVLDTISLKCS